MKFDDALDALRRAGLIAIAAGCLAAGAFVSAHAQGFGGDLGGFSTNPDAPINIESDTLDVDDGKKIAVFKGNVVASQEGFEMRSEELQVSYGAKNAAAQLADQQQSGTSAPTAAGGPGAGTQLKELKATGNVYLKSEKDQTATADWAIFKVEDQQITVGGNVTLSQGQNVMKGEKLLIDLKSGRSRFETSRTGAKPGRIRGVFHPNRKPGKKKPGAKPQGSAWGSQSVLRGVKKTN